MGPIELLDCGEGGSIGGKGGGEGGRTNRLVAGSEGEAAGGEGGGRDGEGGEAGGEAGEGGGRDGGHRVASPEVIVDHGKPPHEFLIAILGFAKLFASVSLSAL